MEALGLKQRAERTKKTPFGRPVRNGKYDMVKSPLELDLQSLPEVSRSALRIISESTATPRSQDKRRMPICLSDSQYAMDALFQ